ncbi:MAG: CBS domain-containing protein [Candidatus Thorarchaeota archaeon]|nr:MAG: CBS domain-containing protein [Candidatus Thorarchaeota archaeon]
MRVRDFMTSVIITAEIETPVSEAIKLMAAEDIGSLIVTRGEVLEGIVTQRDIICARLLSDEVYSTLTLEDIMASPVVTISPDADLGQAVSVMDSTGKKYLPVIEGHDIIGIVTAADVIRILARMKVIAAGVPDDED